jgi:hypothetical protein
MLKIMNEHYYVDLDQIEEYLDMSDIDSDPSDKNISEIKINVIRYEMVKMLLETVLTETEIPDEKLGMKTQLTIPFTLAFNSLLNKKIIKRY